MRAGVPKEVKDHEYRVAITPIGVHELVAHGHEVLIQESAGVGSGITDADYVGAGATMVDRFSRSTPASRTIPAVGTSRAIRAAAGDAACAEAAVPTPCVRREERRASSNRSAASLMWADAWAVCHTGNQTCGRSTWSWFPCVVLDDRGECHRPVSRPAVRVVTG